MRGFFSGSELIAKAPPSLVPLCGQCGLYKSCKSPKMPVSGKGRRKVLLLGEAPGRHEDDDNLQFTGDAGNVLSEALESIGVDMRRDCWLTNALICRPPKNLTPSADQVGFCRPNLMKTIHDLQPQVVIPLGQVACQSMLSGIWKELVGPVSRWVGHVIPNMRPNIWICPNFHPSYVDRESKDEVNFFFRKYLKQAFRMKGRPWQGDPPDYRKSVESLYESAKIVKAVRELREHGKPCAFDYETNMSKPDSQSSEIVCVSISNGDRTIAFPWISGRVVTAFCDFVRDEKVPKIAHNLRHEHRWTKKHLKCRPANWLWDTMVVEHCLDNRTGVCGLKFQSFVKFGWPIYNQHIEPFFDGPSNKPSKIKEVAMKDLLLYCGLDSLLCLMLYQNQKERIGT